MGKSAVVCLFSLRLFAGGTANPWLRTRHVVYPRFYRPTAILISPTGAGWRGDHSRRNTLSRLIALFLICLQMSAERLCPVNLLATRLTPGYWGRRCLNLESVCRLSARAELATTLKEYVESVYRVSQNGIGGGCPDCLVLLGRSSSVP